MAEESFEERVDYVDVLGLKRTMVIRANDWNIFVNRRDTVNAYLADIKAQAPKAEVAPTPKEVARKPETRWCSIHGVEMTKRFAQESGKPYFAHGLEGSRKLCFGRKEKE